jgi:hypothetical protein
MKNDIEKYKILKPNLEKETKTNDGLTFSLYYTGKQLKTKPFLMSKRWKIIEQGFYEKFLFKKETYKMKNLKTR